MGNLQKEDLLLECKMQHNKQENAMGGAVSLLVINSSSLECEGGWLVGSSGVTCVLSVSIILVPGSSGLFDSWLVSGEWGR